jgi:voltage-gated potassium channel
MMTTPALANPFAVLLSSLLLLLVVMPMFQDGSIVSFLINIFFSYILLSSIFTLNRDRRNLFTGLLLVVISFLSSWLYLLTAHPLVQIVSLVAGAIYFLFLASSIVYFLLSKQNTEVNHETIAAALSSYLLIGYGWSFIYAIIYIYIPESFEGMILAQTDVRLRFIYFSFVTLTTLGYGDISPTAPIAEVWAILEAIVGQIYLVVLISGLVGKYISDKSARKKM